jgi:predicted nucleic acid-binding Zn ribbon protein
MTRRKGVYSWDNEPAGERRTGFRTTVSSDWQQSANSTFAEPSRIEHERRRRRRSRISGALIGVVVAVTLTLLALWVMLSRLMSR